MKFELEYVKKLMKMMSDSTLTELELDDGEKKVVLKNEKTVITQMAPQPQLPQSANIQPIEKPSSAVEELKRGKALTSPMVGTFYGSPSPQTDAFVKVGSTVSQGEVVCIIEAMKLMNEIESEYTGKVIELCVKDGQPVEFGQVLMYIE